MSNQHTSNPLPSTARLLKATAAAAAAATLILLTVVLPAEYGVDPTGLGSRLGLLALTPAAQVTAVPVAPGVVNEAPAPTALATNETAAMATQAAAVFGQQPGQSFDAQAVARNVGALRTDTMSVVLAPGKGAEVKATLDAGGSIVFRWSASADVAVDMHGEAPDAKDEYTSYWVESAQREGGGTFTAKFAGQHGWYWRNKGKEPVTVQVSVTGFHTKLFRPGP